MINLDTLDLDALTDEISQAQRAALDYAHPGQLLNAASKAQKLDAGGQKHLTALRLLANATTRDLIVARAIAATALRDLIRGELKTRARGMSDTDLVAALDRNPSGCWAGVIWGEIGDRVEALLGPESFDDFLDQSIKADSDDQYKRDLIALLTA